MSQKQAFDDNPWKGLGLAEELRTVAIAVLESNGRVLEMNRGLREMVGAPNPIAGFDLGPYFIQPKLDELARARATPGEPLYQGLVTIGSDALGYRTLVGSLRRSGKHLLLIAEPSIDDLERLSNTALQLNDEFADTQRMLVRSNRNLRRKEDELEKVVLTDSLTGLPNRRHLEQALNAEIGRCTRSGGDFSIAMVDIDKFKSVNDEHGHGVGDAVLKEFSQVLQADLRIADLASRLGGEEFVLVLPETPREGAMLVTERIRKAIESHPVEALERALTASFGVAQWSPGETAGALLERADRALYQAKEQGRNRSVCAQPAG